ncbi:ABC transporter ATP-binding protein [Bradyrhizobium sp. U87765 SZCCT0131]|uniref:ABC transporter ATP-binding protein n=1 Tax=unclassified Bradyrhizobium TaxID=2631580 RepID=UPI001BA96023|nr:MULTISPECIES: ABC transporter ATP-binding protein [unclassified Bradyrhizobium]MBR1222766.1 ABC transporter ATP-binding protein [Bradyrhizobium sp. U87765 SZCCT0131]MBR1265153.1 ABC transporter ATP-binding protein [Bradyrhizobium sp. U87765 SZCCT0134]MBR1303068.1 ABC transporter ATP-binding protein [Bradyrhizobium sp. U87765 SZCCT0110]MBR1318674.1 ABC transporter ATP-binding protein [Bradyrhizobium sp. U87765 SZCCT0109]MBR1346997.1 ABC transporter ATP-binding protein [Bradyrhizobium sp. U87
MTAARLEVAHLSAGYGPTQIVSDLSFSIDAGHRLAILGRNGVGKTTLLATLMGLTTRHHGQIRVDGQDLADRRASARARSGIGYVPQTRDIFRSLSVEENLVAGLKGRPRTALAEAYEMFPRLGERRRHLGQQLSGGEQQMLSMARTLLGQPSILLLDEPLEGLAPVICDELMAMIARLAASGDMTVVLVEQQIERALDFADTVIVIERGRAAWTGAAKELQDDRVLVERLLGVGIH